MVNFITQKAKNIAKKLKSFFIYDFHGELREEDFNINEIDEFINIAIKCGSTFVSFQESLELRVNKRNLLKFWFFYLIDLIIFVRLFLFLIDYDHYSNGNYLYFLGLKRYVIYINFLILISSLILGKFAIFLILIKSKNHAFWELKKFLTNRGNENLKSYLEKNFVDAKRYAFNFKNVKN